MWVARTIFVLCVCHQTPDENGASEVSSIIMYFLLHIWDTNNSNFIKIHFFFQLYEFLLQNLSCQETFSRRLILRCIIFIPQYYCLSSALFWVCWIFRDLFCRFRRNYSWSKCPESGGWNITLLLRRKYFELQRQDARYISRSGRSIIWPSATESRHSWIVSVLHIVSW